MEVAGGKVGGRWQVAIAGGGTRNGKVAGADEWQRCHPLRNSGIGGNVAWRWQARTGGYVTNERRWQGGKVEGRWQVVSKRKGGKQGRVTRSNDATH